MHSAGLLFNTLNAGWKFLDKKRKELSRQWNIKHHRFQGKEYSGEGNHTGTGAFSSYEDAANQESPASPFELRKYKNKQDRYKSIEKTLKYYTKAAVKSHVQAKLSSGLVYATEKGQVKAKEEMVKAYPFEAAQEGYAKAQNGAGRIYLDAYYEVEAEEEEAEKGFIKAAEQGIDTQFDLEAVKESSEDINVKMVSQLVKSMGRWLEDVCEEKASILSEPERTLQNQLVLFLENGLDNNDVKLEEVTLVQDRLSVLSQEIDEKIVPENKSAITAPDLGVGQDNTGSPREMVSLQYGMLFSPASTSSSELTLAATNDAFSPDGPIAIPSH
jgi:hypothetical protein